MKTCTLHTVALALTLGFATAASAGDFDFGHPDQDLLTLHRSAAAASTPQKASAQRVAATAETLKPEARGGVSTEASRAMVREDSGSFWMTQHPAHPRSPAAVAKVEAGMR